MSKRTAIELAASAARVATGTGSSVDLGTHTTARLYLTVSAVSGTTPTLLVDIETSRDGVVWRALGSFASVNAAGVSSKNLPGADRYVRAKWTIAGTTPSFTFSVAGDSVLVYATPSDFLRFALPSGVLAAFSDDAKDKAIEAAGDVAESHFPQGSYSYPLTTWGDELRRAVIGIAAFDLMTVRGFNPADGGNILIVKRHDDAMAWLRLVATHKAGLSGATVDATPDEVDGVYASSYAPRGVI